MMFFKNQIVTDSEYAKLHRFCESYIENHCVVKKKMPGKQKGSTLNKMFYLRRGLFKPEFSIPIAKMFVYKIRQIFGEKIDFQICGLETGATPLLASIPIIAENYGIKLNSFVVRKEAKPYGLLNIIEGMPNEKKALIIDDICNSSSSMKKCYDILIKENLQPFDHVFSIVKKVKSKNGSMPETTKYIYLYEFETFIN
jgi:orotate phosphoribosyltransferase